MTTRRRAPKDINGVLKTQVGPRTQAPMWARPLLTSGEWDVYTALWSYPIDSVFPTHQELADRAICERGTAADAVKRFETLGLLVRERHQREDGSDTSNTYYLIEVPTEEHLAQAAEFMAKRALEQDAKRKKRKATNRRYAAKTTASEQQTEAADGPPDGGTAQEVPPSNGGTAQEVPRGYGTGSTSGGTAQEVPGYGAGRTHETLGVEVLSKGTVRTSPPPTPSAADVETSPPDRGEDPEQKTQIPSEFKNQESAIPDDYWPDGWTDWEEALHAECMAIRKAWSPRRLRQVIGWHSIRERAELNPELVRRAFLIGANTRGTVSPKRLLHEYCPHWQQAADQLRAEQERAAAGEPPAPDPAPAGPEPDEPTPARRPAPEQRAAARVAPVSPGAPNAAYLAQKATQAERARERREAHEREAQERAEQLAALFRDVGAGGGVGVEATLGDPVLGDLAAAPALVPAGGNTTTVR